MGDVSPGSNSAFFLLALFPPHSGTGLTVFSLQLNSRDSTTGIMTAGTPGRKADEEECTSSAPKELMLTTEF